MNTNIKAVHSASDLSLIQRIQSGDSQAFADLFYAHKPRIYSVCLRMTNNVAEAEDLTQDAFLQVFRKLATFRGDSAISTWLYRVAVNTVLMHFRKKALRQISLDEPCRQKDGRAARREYGLRDERLTGTIDRIALSRAVRELPVGYRRIFLLHEVQGYEHQEIAQLLHCSVGNSKSQLHKAKQRIQELLSGAVERSRPPRGKRMAPRQQTKQKPATENLAWKESATKNHWTPGAVLTDMTAIAGRKSWMEASV